MEIPNEVRFKKVANIGLLSVFSISLIFSTIIYFCFGKYNIPDIVFLIQDYKPFGDGFKKVYHLLLGIYMIAIPLSLSVFNFSIKSYT